MRKNLKTINIGNYSASYDKFISDINMEYILTSAAEALEKCTDPFKAATHFINTSSFRMLYFNLQDFIPYNEETDNLAYSAGAAFLLSQIAMCLVIAEIAGFNPSDDEVQTFILSNFHNKYINSTFSTPDSSSVEIFTYGVLHTLSSLASSEILGRRARDFFFKKHKK